MLLRRGKCVTEKSVLLRREQCDAEERRVCY